MSAQPQTAGPIESREHARKRAFKGIVGSAPAHHVERQRRRLRRKVEAKQQEISDAKNPKLIQHGQDAAAADRALHRLCDPKQIERRKKAKREARRA